MKRQRAAALILGVRFNKIKKPFLALLFLIPLSACSAANTPKSPTMLSASNPQKVSVANSPQPKRTVEKPKEPARANDWIQQSHELYQEEFIEKPTPSDALASRRNAADALNPSGEWFIDFHIGPAWTQDADISANLRSSPLEGTLFDVDFSTSVSLGGRFGYWLQAYPNLALAIDVSHFRPDLDRQTVGANVSLVGLGLSATGIAILDPVDISVTEISFDVMLRHPVLITNEFPNGQFQPYVTLGPGIFVTKAELTSGLNDTDVSVGVKIGTGVAWQFHRYVALFTEYRFTYFSPDLNANGIEVDTDVRTHRLLFGISYRFQL